MHFASRLTWGEDSGVMDTHRTPARRWVRRWRARRYSTPRSESVQLGVLAVVVVVVVVALVLLVVLKR
jgi:uncharacterized membrane protein YidH (DUF202 family)